jgi:hypothetical protein
MVKENLALKLGALVASVAFASGLGHPDGGVATAPTEWTPAQAPLPPDDVARGVDSVAACEVACPTFCTETCCYHRVLGCRCECQ